MKDFFGREIRVGDTVAFMQLRYRNLLTGTVTKLAGSTQVLISHNMTNDCRTETRQDGSQVIVKV